MWFDIAQQNTDSEDGRRYGTTSDGRRFLTTRGS
jgi:hypothetical protein